jgi:predicted MFS family arabinose efflux permease
VTSEGATSGRGQTDSRPDGLGRAKIGLLVLAFAAFAAVTTEMMPMGLLPDIAASFGTSESQIGVIVSLYALVVAVGAVPVTIATRRLPGKALLFGTAVAYAVSNTISALSLSFEVLAGARLLGGATHALFFSWAIGYATRLVPSHLAGRALALASTGGSAGFIVGVPLATAVGNAVGWRAAFWLLVGVMVCTAALIAFLLPDVRATDDGRRQVTGRKRDLTAVIATNTLTFLGHYCFYTYVTVLLLSSGIPAVWVAPVLLVFGVFGLLGIGVSAPHLDPRPRLSALTIIGIVGAGLVCVGAGVPFALPVLVAGAIWCGAFGAFPSLMQSAAVRTRAVSPELAGAWVNSTANLGIAIGALIGGAVLDALDIRFVAWVGAAFVLVAMVVVVVGRGAFPSRPPAASFSSSEELRSVSR